LPVETVGSHLRSTSGWRRPPIAIILDFICAWRVAGCALFHPSWAVESLLSAKDDGTQAPLQYGGRSARHRKRRFAIFGGISMAEPRAHGDQYSCRRIQSISGIGHAVFILVFMLVAGPLASFIPLSTLAGAGGGLLEYGGRKISFSCF
jgi:SulP family sulfate permease